MIPLPGIVALGSGVPRTLWLQCGTLAAARVHLMDQHTLLLAAVPVVGVAAGFINTLAGSGSLLTLPILIPFVFFSHALNKVWRRHMLRQHGLDAGLVDALSRQKNAHIHEAYIERYGPRSGPSSSHDI